MRNLYEFDRHTYRVLRHPPRTTHVYTTISSHIIFGQLKGKFREPIPNIMVSRGEGLFCPELLTRTGAVDVHSDADVLAEQLRWSMLIGAPASVTVTLHTIGRRDQLWMQVIIVYRCFIAHNSNPACQGRSENCVNKGVHQGRNYILFKTLSQIFSYIFSSCGEIPFAGSYMYVYAAQSISSFCFIFLLLLLLTSFLLFLFLLLLLIFLLLINVYIHVVVHKNKTYELWY